MHQRVVKTSWYTQPLSFLLALPLLYAFAGIFLRWALGGYYQTAIDPEYSYLFNSLNVAQGSLKVWHVDHPGTPLQLIGACVLRLVHLFAGHGPLVKDVIENPELYLGAINITLVLLNAAALYALGRTVVTITRNIFWGLFMQITPLLSITLLHITMRVAVEQTVLLSEMLLLAVVIKLATGAGPVKTARYILAMAFLVAFAAASKIIAAPVFMVGFFLLPGCKKKFWYAMATGIFFFVLISPVFLYRAEYFSDWIKNLFIHSGKYGSGEAPIVDKASFLHNLRDIFSQDICYTGAVAFSIPALLIYNLPIIKPQYKNDRVYRTLIGTLAAMMLNIIMVAKHYAYYYLVTSLALNTFMIYLLLNLFVFRWRPKYHALFFCLALGILLYKTATEFALLARNLVAKRQERLRTKDFITANLKGKKTLVVPDYYGSAYKESAITFGIYWSGNFFTHDYKSVCNEIYGNTYLFAGGDGRFHDWKDQAFSIKQCLGTDSVLYIYSNAPASESGLPELKSGGGFGGVIPSVIYTNPALQETIYLLKKSAAVTGTLACDAETTTADRQHFIGTAGALFAGGANQSGDKARSGKNAVKLTPGAEFAMTLVIVPQPVNTRLRISVWRHSGNPHGSLVISTRDNKKLYLGTSEKITAERDWEKLELEYTVDTVTTDETLLVYVWSYDHSPVYFDDLTVEKR